MSEKIEHCCIYMDYALSGRNGHLVEYMPEIRSYSLRFYTGDEFTGMEKELWYCPWCGTKLPQDLDGIWGKTLEREYGLTEEERDEGSKIPEEFRTDEWWKKRGL